jgi:hypothetical protein
VLSKLSIFCSVGSGRIVAYPDTTRSSSSVELAVTRSEQSMSDSAIMRSLTPPKRSIGCSLTYQ